MTDTRPAITRLFDEARADARRSREGIDPPEWRPFEPSLEACQAAERASMDPLIVRSAEDARTMFGPGSWLARVFE